jgi:hypothetical protein
MGKLRLPSVREQIHAGAPAWEGEALTSHYSDERWSAKTVAQGKAVDRGANGVLFGTFWRIRVVKTCQKWRKWCTF